MSIDPQNPTHPELGPGPSVVRVDNGIAPTGGTLIFNRAASLPQAPQHPTVIINQAISAGDTMEKRIKACFESLIPEQK